MDGIEDSQIHEREMEEASQQQAHDRDSSAQKTVSNVTASALASLQKTCLDMHPATLSKILEMGTRKESHLTGEKARKEAWEQE